MRVARESVFTVGVFPTPGSGEDVGGECVVGEGRAADWGEERAGSVFSKKRRG